MARPVSRRYLTIEAAADYTGLTIEALRARVKKRTIPFIKDGKRVMFDSQELDGYMAARRVATKWEVENRDAAAS